MFFYRYVFETLRQANAGLINTFGSLDQRVTNVIYTNGDLDPWFGHGIIYTHDRDSVVFNIERKIFIVFFLVI